jgi:hypothetical protein
MYLPVRKAPKALANPIRQDEWQTVKILSVFQLYNGFSTNLHHIHFLFRARWYEHGWQRFSVPRYYQTQSGKLVR